MTTEAAFNLWGLIALMPGAAVFAMLVAGTLIARRELSAMVKVEVTSLREPLTVIIPARNEGDRLGATLAALAADPSEALRVVVLDDASTDNTADLVREFALHDVRFKLLEAGSARAEHQAHQGLVGFGKPLALALATTAAAPAKGWTLFLDADVVLRPGALGGIVAAASSTDAKVLSGAPKLVCGSALEAMLVPAFVSAVSSRYLVSRVHDRARTDAFLNGQLILVDRAALDDVGGWLSVKDTVLEDVALARRFKDHGLRIRLADLRAVASTRMYTSWGELRQGFGKNAVALHGGAWRTAVLGILSVLLAWAPLCSVVASAWIAWRHASSSDGGALTDGWTRTSVVAPVAVSLALLGGVFALQAGLRRRAQVPAWPVFLVPAFYPLVGWVFVEAAWKSISGGKVHWKGRTYDAGARKGQNPSS